MYIHIPLLFRSTLAVACGLAAPSLSLAGEPSPHLILVRTAPRIAPIAAVVDDDEQGEASKGAKPESGKEGEKADEKKQELAQATVESVVTAIAKSADDAEQAMPEYWLGIHLEPLPELVKSQLTLEHGIVVHATLPDSPAAKAGLKTHDILLAANEQPLKEPVDLIDLLDKTKDKAIKLTFLRAGKKETLDITPSKRPENLAAVAALVADDVAEVGGDLDAPIRKLEEAIRELQARHGGVAPRVLLMHPPIMLPPGAPIPGAPELGAAPRMPANLSVTISKSGNSPAKIHVEQDGKKWDVTEDKLAELPEDVRAHVQRMTGATQVEVEANPMADGQLRLNVRTLARPDMLPHAGAPQVQRVFVVPPGAPAAPGVPPVWAPVAPPVPPAPPAPPAAQAIPFVPGAPGVPAIKSIPAPGAPAIAGGLGGDAAHGAHKEVRVHVVQKNEDVVVKKLDEILKRLEALEKKID